MKLPRHAGRWFAAVPAVAILPVFIFHPIEVGTVITAGLLLLAAWDLIFGPSRRSLPKKGKDRTFVIRLGLELAICTVRLTNPPL
jgi:hypothetical protein